MSKKDLFFIVGLSILMGVIWIAGELVMGLWIAVVPETHVFWTVGIVIVTVAVSVWHSMIEDESDEVNPRKAKYRRKIEKRRKK